MNTDKKIIEQHAAGRWLEILPALAPQLTEAVNKCGKHVKCPNGSGEKDGFRLYKDAAKTGGGVSNTGGSFANGFDLLMWINGYNFKQALTDVNEYLGDVSNNSTPKPTKIQHDKETTQPPKINAFVAEIWNQASSEISEPVKKYLISRGLQNCLILPDSIKCHPNLAHKDKQGFKTHSNALIGTITINDKQVGIQRQYLTTEGLKADLDNPKQMLGIHTGAISGGAVRLSEPTGDTLAITEGIENALAVQQATDLPAWAATTGTLMAKVLIPESVKIVHIFADKDKNNAGRNAANKLAQRLLGDSKTVFIHYALMEIAEEQKGVDWLDQWNESGEKAFKHSLAIAKPESSKQDIAQEKANQKQEKSQQRELAKQQKDLEIQQNLNSSNGELDRRINELNKTYAFVTIGSKAAVMRKITNHETNEIEYSMLLIPAFRDLLGNEEVIVGYGTDGKPKYKPLGTTWLAHENRRTYGEGMYFLPMSKPLPDVGYQQYPNKLNTWMGFGIKPISYTEEAIEPIIEHLHGSLCKGNENYFQYLIQWMAYGFQYPEKQIGVAVVLRGLKGTGKGVIGSLLLGMYGQHSVHLSNSHHLTGNFNGHLENTCYVFADEAVFHGDNAGNQRLKALVTENKFTVERKGFDAIQAPNRLNILMASNSDWVIPSSRDERRWFVLDLLDKKLSNKYYEDLHHAAADKNVQAQFLDYLLKMDLSKFKVRQYPETEGNKNQKLHSLSVIPRFLLDACERGYIAEAKFALENSDEWHDKVTANLIMEGINEWGKNNFKSNYDRPTKKQLTDYLNGLGLKTNTHRDLGCYKNGSPFTRERARGYFIGIASELEQRIINHEGIPSNENQ